jgi:hypothetical protein
VTSEYRLKSRMICAGPPARLALGDEWPDWCAEHDAVDSATAVDKFTW